MNQENYVSYSFKEYKLSSGHMILTPTGAEITEAESKKYLQICLEWLKELSLDSYLSMMEEIGGGHIRGSQLSVLLDYLRYPESPCCGRRHFLDARVLAFLYVVSYEIQQENRKCINPFLANVIGNALLEWLPIPHLVEHYLAISAQNGACEDAVTLVRIFSGDIGYIRRGFRANKKKAFKYARMAYNSPFNHHGINLSDLAYAKALYAFDKSSAETAMDIVIDKINLYMHQEDKQETLVLEYLKLGLETMATNNELPYTLDQATVEFILGKVENKGYLFEECAYWFAECLIDSVYYLRDLQKAEKLLVGIENPTIVHQACYSLAKAYLYGDDPSKKEEAHALLSFAKVQRIGFPIWQRKSLQAVEMLIDEAL